MSEFNSPRARAIAGGPAPRVLLSTTLRDQEGNPRQLHRSELEELCRNHTTTGQVAIELGIDVRRVRQLYSGFGLVPPELRIGIEHPGDITLEQHVIQTHERVDNLIDFKQEIGVHFLKTATQLIAALDLKPFSQVRRDRAVVYKWED